MKSLKLNPFWTMAGVLGLGVVAILAGLYLPTSSTASDLRRAIGNSKGNLDMWQANMKSDEAIAALTERKQTCISDYQKISEFYLKSDAELERWFPGITSPNPGWPEYSTHYKDECKKLEERMAAAKVRLGSPPPEEGAATSGKAEKGFYWYAFEADKWDAIPLQDRQGQPGRVELGQPSVLRMVQRHFRISEHVVNACLGPENRPQVVALRSIGFLRLPHAKLADTESGLPGWDTTNPAPLGNMAGTPGPDYQEADLPDQLGRTITFLVRVELAFENIPGFLRELLRPSREPKVTMNIIGTKIYIDGQNELVKEGEARFPKNDFAKRQEAMKSVEERLRKEVVPRTALLWVAGQAFDFDPQKVERKW